MRLVNFLFHVKEFLIFPASPQQAAKEHTCLKKTAYLQHLAVFSKIIYVAIPLSEVPPPQKKKFSPKIAVTKSQSDLCPLFCSLKAGTVSCLLIMGFVYWGRNNNDVVIGIDINGVCVEEMAF